MGCVILILLILIILRLILILLNTLIGIRTHPSREKLSPFECGFEPLSSARLFFSLRFYIIAIIFLIFDIELTLIFPVPIAIKFFQLNNPLILIRFFIIILLIGLAHEWLNGSLE